MNGFVYVLTDGEAVVMGVVVYSTGGAGMRVVVG